MMNEIHDELGIEKSGQEALSPNKYIGNKIYRQLQGHDEESKTYKYELGIYQNTFYTEGSFLDSFCENIRLCPYVYVFSKGPK